MSDEVIFVLIETEHDRMGSFSQVIDWDYNRDELQKRKENKEESASRICEYRIERVFKTNNTR